MLKRISHYIVSIFYQSIYRLFVHVKLESLYKLAYMTSLPFHSRSLLMYILICPALGVTWARGGSTKPFSSILKLASLYIGIPTLLTKILPKWERITWHTIPEGKIVIPSWSIHSLLFQFPNPLTLEGD